MQLPTLKLEIDLWKKGFLVVGIDEVGRGSFAGPLVVGSAVLKPNLNKNEINKLLALGINDSKKLSKAKRELINKSVQEFVFNSELQYINVEIINNIGIGKATSLGFTKVAETLSKKHPKEEIFFLTDAFSIPSIPTTNQLNIIRGDSTSLSIATASILAKVDRDAHMDELSSLFPHYSLSQNKGYGTLSHRNALKKHGASKIHRKDFIAKTLAH